MILRMVQRSFMNQRMGRHKKPSMPSIGWLSLPPTFPIVANRWSDITDSTQISHVDYEKKPAPRANGPPTEIFIIYDESSPPSADDYLIDADYPIEIYL